MAYPASLQQQFQFLYQQLNSSCTEFQAHRDAAAAAGVDAQTQRQFMDKANSLLGTVGSAIGIPEMTDFWVGHKPAVPGYDVMLDLVQLEDDLKAFNQLVFRDTPTDADYVKDTYILMDGMRQSELPASYNGPSIVSYEPRHYTATQATNSGYIAALDAIIATMDKILSS